ncbi:MAG TPA: hypothetical protein VEA60_04135 [Allosphingosinicella sp.]|nr:hypothetical protein [Allosphingosinicella sp.]
MGRKSVFESAAFWRSTRDLLKWTAISIPPLIAFSIMAILGTVQAFPETKPWAADFYARVVIALADMTLWFASVIVAVLWFAAFVWAGRKVEIAERAHESGSSETSRTSDLAELAADAAEMDREGDIGLARSLGRVEAVAVPAPPQGPSTIEKLLAERERGQRRLRKMRHESVEHALKSYSVSVETAVRESGQREGHFVTMEISQRLSMLRIATGELEKNTGVQAPELANPIPIVKVRECLDLSHNEVYIRQHRENVQKAYQQLKDLGEAKKKLESELAELESRINTELWRIESE